MKGVWPSVWLSEGLLGLDSLCGWGEHRSGPLSPLEALLVSRSQCFDDGICRAQLDNEVLLPSYSVGLEPSAGTLRDRMTSSVLPQAPSSVSLCGLFSKLE